MCGIIGVFGCEDAERLVKVGLKILKNRGQDGFGCFSDKNFSLGHCLHSIVGRVEQPLVEKNDNTAFVSNCEIYNWKKLNQQYNLDARNDSEVIFKLLKKKGLEILKELDGVYAFAFLSKDRLVIARDIMGVKPLWYSHSVGFHFASEKKALEKLGLIDINELNPRKIMEYNLEDDSIRIIEKSFFSTTPLLKAKKDEIVKKVDELLENAITKRIPERKFGVLFSGGIDSTMIAKYLLEKGVDFTCYTAVLDDSNMKEPEDLLYAKRIATELGLKLKIVKIKFSDVPKYLKVIVPLIEDSNVIKVGVALPFYAACEEAHKDGCKVLFSGLGSEEIFAGYQRHKESLDINKECVSGLLKMYERDLYRDDVVTMHNQIELRLPYLDLELVRYALRIPQELKLKEGHEKFILRVVAKNKNLDDAFAFRKKKAAQYGSNFHKALEKLTRQNKFGKKSEYLRTFYPTHNVKLGALFSSGKDSVYALYIMMKQNYEVSCLITLQSGNLDSYMFHTPTIDLVDLQAESMKIPLIKQVTKGEKEVELEDLKKALQTAKKKYNIEGIVTGALFSNYQRDRVENICDKLSLKIFNPLWHINQETEMREIVREGFSFVMTKIAADGLDKGWLNKTITNEDIDKLVSLNKKIGINIAGEGGEFESLVLDGPIFDKKIELTETEINEEDEITATLIVKKARLLSKL